MTSHSAIRASALLTAVAADFRIGAELAAYGRSLRSAEQPAEMVFVQVQAAYARGLAGRHARQRRGNRRCYAAGAAAGSTLHGKDLARKLAEERPGQPSETGAKNTDRPGRRQARRISGAFPPRDARCEAATARGCRQRTARPWPTPSLPAIARGPARAGRGIAPPSSGRGRRCQRNSSSRRPRPARPRSDLPPRHRRYRTSAPAPRRQDRATRFSSLSASATRTSTPPWRGSNDSS